MIRPSSRNSWSASAVAVSLCFGLALGPVQADPACDEDNPEGCAVPLAKGQPAPFTGQLLSTDLAIELGMKADTCDRRLDLELDFQRERLELKIELQKELLRIEREGFQEQKKLLFKRLSEAEGVSWYEHPAFVAPITAVAVILVVIGSGYALNSAK